MRTTLGLPGTGLSYSSYMPYTKLKPKAHPDHLPPPLPKDTSAPVQVLVGHRIEEKQNHPEVWRNPQSNSSSWWPGLGAIAFCFLLGTVIIHLILGK